MEKKELAEILKRRIKICETYEHQEPMGYGRCEYCFSYLKKKTLKMITFQSFYCKYLPEEKDGQKVIDFEYGLKRLEKELTRLLD